MRGLLPTTLAIKTVGIRAALLRGERNPCDGLATVIVAGSRGLGGGGVEVKAVIFHGKGDVRVETVPDPAIEQPTDAIVKITTSAICGSDLHPYHGRVGVGDVFPIGHEFVGVVEEVGPEVRGVRPGDRVVAPFSVSCGSCYTCRNGLPSQCETTGRGVFGMGVRRGSFPGAQA